MRRYRILNIDAWLYDDGWTWNSSTEVDTVDLQEEPPADDTDNKWVTDLLLEKGMVREIEPGAKHWLTVEEYGEMNYEVQDATTGEPLFALEEVPAW